MITVINAKSETVTLADRQRAHEILRIAYALTEVEVWGENYLRITFEDYNKLIDKSEVLMAYHEGIVVGAIHYYLRRAHTYCFSLLCADFDKTGLGIGRALVNRVEAIAKENLATTIELEILRPRGIEVPFKIRISDWYQRMGYVYTHSQNFAEVIPIKAKKLINICDFDYYLKKIKQ